MPDLLPCPFCDDAELVLIDGKPIGNKHGILGTSYVQCTNCGAAGPVGFWGEGWAGKPTYEQGRQDAIAAWNARGSIAARQAQGAEKEKA
jgi:Lar family restriction alleviation protein